MKMFTGIRQTLSLLLLIVIVQESVSPPVTQKKKGYEDNKIDEEAGEDPPGLMVEYDRYLKEVVTALESDPEFKTKLEKAEEGDIRSGKIAMELEYVNHHVRTKLDEIKRSELERLRHLAIKEYELRNGMDTDHMKVPPEHLDYANPHTFEAEDLRKLILKTTADLEEADRKRRQEFKEYEMQKEFEKQEKLKDLDEEHKKQMLQEIEEREKKHKQHEPLHHPGSKQQLEEVWEKQDHMENQEFNPKTFFHLHDLDGNGVWDANEVKALFLKELDKMYTPGATEDDMRERVEELERMREHVFKEADVNNDSLISYQEFLTQTQKAEFEKDPGWEGLDEQQIYTQDEYKEFEKRRQEEIQRLIAQGVLPPHPNGMPPHPGYQQGAYGQPYQQQFPAHHPGMQQGQPVHPGQGYQGQQYADHPNQISQGQMYPNQVHPGQMPQGQIHPGQVPQGQMHPGQGQMYHGQVPQGQIYPGQGQPGQMHPGQVPQGQIHPGQMTQGQMPPNQVAPGQVPQAQGQVPQAQPGQAPPQAQPGQVPPQVQGGEVPPQAQPGQVSQAQPGQIPPQAQPGQAQPAQAPPQAQPGQVPPQAQAGQGNPSKVQKVNIQPLPKHVRQPVGEMREPIDVNKLLQDDGKADSNPPPQVQQVR